MNRQKDLRELKATSSLLTFLRYGGVLEVASFKLRAAQVRRAIVLYQNEKWQTEFAFNTEGLSLAIMTIIEKCYPVRTT